MEDLHRRIRALRMNRGWTGCYLAREAGVSAAYLSLIEHGHRVPSIEVAARIASVLEEDPDPYRHWAAYHRVPIDLRQENYVGDSSSDRSQSRDRRRKLPPGRPPKDRLAFDGDNTAVDPSQLITVPVLAPGRVSDPLAPEQAMARFHLDPQLLSHNCSNRLFAIRLDRSNTRFVTGLMRPGDLTVIDCELPQQLGSTLIYAWNIKEGLLLSRAIFIDRAAVLTPVGDERVTPHTIPFQSEQELHELLLGVVIWSSRNWASQPTL